MEELGNNSEGTKAGIWKKQRKGLSGPNKQYSHQLPNILLKFALVKLKNLEFFAQLTPPTVNVDSILGHLFFDRTVVFDRGITKTYSTCYTIVNEHIN